MSCRRGRAKSSWVWRYFRDVPTGAETTCLVDGCRATVVGNPAYLLAHLRQKHGIHRATPPVQNARVVVEEGTLDELREIKNALLDDGWVDLAGTDRPRLRRILANYAHFAALYDAMGLSRTLIPLGEIAQHSDTVVGAYEVPDAAPLPIIVNPRVFAEKWGDGVLDRLLDAEEEALEM